MSSGVLAGIVERRRERLAHERAAFSAGELGDRAAAWGAPRSLANALVTAEGSVAIIAEIKRGSASLGPAFATLDAAAQAQRYADGGAAAISVVGERDVFCGRPEDDVAAARASGLPVLYKDFLTDPWQAGWARALGADAVLYLAALHHEQPLRELLAAARDLGMDALVEVHDESELERAVAAGASLVGVNARDLRSFVTDLAVCERLAPLIPAGVTRVAESGIAGAGDIARLAAYGYRAFLIGELLLRSADPAARIRELSGRAA